MIGLKLFSRWFCCSNRACNKKGCVEVPSKVTGELFVRSERAGFKLELTNNPLKSFAREKTDLKREESIVRVIVEYQIQVFFEC